MLSNEEKLEALQDVETAKQADELLRNNLLISLIFTRKNQACEAFMQTNRNDDTGRRDAWQKAQAATAIEADLQELVNRGNIAKTLLAEQDQLPKSNNPLGE